MPIARIHTHDEAAAFAKRIADAVADSLPEISTTERMKAKRKGRLYVDWLQNGRGKTIVAPYTLRALDGAPVSCPIAWSEVTEKLDPARLGMRAVLKRVEKHGDLFAPVLSGKARLPLL